MLPRKKDKDKSHPFDAVPESEKVRIRRRCEYIMQSLIRLMGKVAHTRLIPIDADRAEAYFGPQDTPP